MNFFLSFLTYRHCPAHLFIVFPGGLEVGLLEKVVPKQFH